MRIAILGSTRGTSMVPIVESIKYGSLNAEVALVISNKEDALILTRAKDLRIPAIFIEPKHLSRYEYDAKVATILQEYNIDLIVLIGYMRILSNEFVAAFHGKIINIHPSLLPAFAGGMDLDVHQAVCDSGVKESGCTVHIVTEEVDAGPILVQMKCAVLPDDSAERLKQRVQALEGDALIAAIKQFENKSVTKDLIMNVTPVKRALLSVSNKQGIVDFAKHLTTLGIDIISTGGTSKALTEAGIPHRQVDELTGYAEMLDGRVKTLHPLIHGGILGKRDKHASDASQHGIEWIDLVVVNFYPFGSAIKEKSMDLAEAIEYIDIGGPTMVRAAAKNLAWVGAVIDPIDYPSIINELQQHSGLSLATKKNLAAKVFQLTATYDAMIQNYLNPDDTRHKQLQLTESMELRYGENPHQKASAYQLDQQSHGVLTAKQYQGKPLSYNNLLDADAALNCVAEFDSPACVIVKHANPCGAALGVNIEEAYKNALHADSVSAFGGVVALNRPCTKELATSMAQIFFEVILAPGFDEGAKEVFASKPNLRILELPIHIQSTAEMKFITGGLLLQDKDRQVISSTDIQVVTKRQPNSEETSAMLFAWQVLKHIKSNAILIARDQVTVGIGAGQVSRIDAVQLAVKKAGDKIDNCILASDAFFPFRDSIDELKGTGIRAIIQPGGSVRDEEVIAACNELDIAMVFTGKRCFRH